MRKDWTAGKGRSVRTGLERAGVYALDTMSCEGGGFGATELRPGKNWGKINNKSTILLHKPFDILGQRCACIIRQIQ